VTRGDVQIDGVDLDSPRTVLAMSVLGLAATDLDTRWALDRDVPEELAAVKDAMWENRRLRCLQALNAKRSELDEHLDEHRKRGDTRCGIVLDAMSASKIAKMPRENEVKLSGHKYAEARMKEEVEKIKKRDEAERKMQSVAVKQGELKAQRDERLKEQAAAVAERREKVEERLQQAMTQQLEKREGLESKLEQDQARIAQSRKLLCDQRDQRGRKVEEARAANFESARALAKEANDTYRAAQLEKAERMMRRDEEKEVRIASLKLQPVSPRPAARDPSEQHYKRAEARLERHAASVQRAKQKTRERVEEQKLKRQERHEKQQANLEGIKAAVRAKALAMFEQIGDLSLQRGPVVDRGTPTPVPKRPASRQQIAYKLFDDLTQTNKAQLARQKEQARKTYLQKIEQSNERIAEVEAQRQQQARFAREQMQFTLVARDQVATLVQQLQTMPLAEIEKLQQGKPATSDDAKRERD